MKLGIFTDAHYSSASVTCTNRYNSKSLDKIKKAYEYFKAENAELVICLGDLTDTEKSHEKEVENLAEIAEVIKASGIKTICVMGNHDGFCYTLDEFYGILGGCKPEKLCVDGKNLVFIDACHFQNGRHYEPGDSDWTDTFYPYVSELESYLESISGDTYVFLHQNIDEDIREDHRVKNASEIREILKKSGKVKCVFQGHYHPGYKSLKNGVEYVTFPAMCSEENGWYITEL